MTAEILVYWKMDAGSKKNNNAFRKHLLHFIDIEQKKLVTKTESMK